jgi:hypothetical protein
MTRRSLLSLLGAGLLLSLRSAAARALSPGETLLTAPLQLGGSWGGSAVTDAATVLERMRIVCLAGVALLSDHQPARLRVDDRAGSFPAIWLHTDAPTTAWITVIVGTRDWCNLAYQLATSLGTCCATAGSRMPARGIPASGSRKPWSRPSLHADLAFWPTIGAGRRRSRTTPPMEPLSAINGRPSLRAIRRARQIRATPRTSARGSRCMRLFSWSMGPRYRRRRCFGHARIA